jgi:hypothetical protein
MKVKQLLDLPCSFFANTYSKPLKDVPVSVLFSKALAAEPVKPPDLAKCTSLALDTILKNHVRDHGKDPAYAKMKEFQCAVTPSGLFRERRTYEHLEEVNPLLIVDIDNIKVTKAKLDLYKKYPWIVGAGESMSRQGLWLLVYIESPTLAKEHFLALRDVFSEADDLKDTTRLRYISYGYSWQRAASETIKPFTKTKPLPIDDIYETRQLPTTDKHDNPGAIQETLNIVGSIDEAGGLHPWTVRVAARANRKGISSAYGVVEIWNAVKSNKIIKETERYTFDRFKIDWDKIYREYKHEHHLESKVRISKSQVSRFNAKLYARSPKVLQELVALVEQKEEKEVVYFTALILLGSLFPNRAFRYFNNTYYPTLYGYILGDAASFKGKAKIIRTALKPYQQIVDDTYKQKQDMRNSALAFNKENKDNKQPIDKVADLNYFFDGNTSSAAMLKALQDSPMLVMFETEGDTITKTWKTDWGNYSDILRKAFEHESLYSLKKNGNEENLLRIHIQNPKLSVLVSSTEQQMRKVLSADETENGLMSRFLFYVVQNDKKWYNGWESNTSADIEAILRDRIPPAIWLSWTTQNDVMYKMSNEAHQYHQDYFNYINDNWPDELFGIISLIRRAGTATARIALLIEELSALDNPRPKSGALTIRVHTISGESMKLAVDIMKVLLQHLFVAWQITYKETDFKETNVQSSETRNAVTQLMASNPTIGSKLAAKQLGISRDLARYHITEVRRKAEDKATKRGKS